MTKLEIFVPIGLLLVSFILKLAVGRDPKIPELIHHIIDLPSDFSFIALSFLSAAIIINANYNIIYFLFLLGIFVIIVLSLLFRAKSIKFFDINKKKYLIIFTTLNYTINIIFIYFFIYYLLYYTKE